MSSTVLDKAAAVIRNPEHLNFPGAAGWEVGGTPEFQEAMKARNREHYESVRNDLMAWISTK